MKLYAYTGGWWVVVVVLAIGSSFTFAGFITDMPAASIISAVLIMTVGYLLGFRHGFTARRPEGESDS